MPIKTTTLFSYLENRLVDFTVNKWYKLENKTNYDNSRWQIVIVDNVRWHLLDNKYHVILSK